MSTDSEVMLHFSLFFGFNLSDNLAFERLGPELLSIPPELNGVGSLGSSLLICLCELLPYVFRYLQLLVDWLSFIDFVHFSLK